MPRVPTSIAALPLVALPTLVGGTMWGRFPAWAWMWGVAVAIFAGCKLLSWLPCRTRATVGRHLTYLFAWPGLDAEAFLGKSSVAPPSSREWAFATAKTVFGVALLAIACAGVDRHAYAVGWLGMLGLIFALHFGSFHLLSCWWRSRGIDAASIMNNPIASRSVGEFWGRRWNTAFRDLTHRFLFAPLSRRLGPRAAVAVGFVASGLVHEAVITLPARGGFGGPTVFFAVQGAAILFERSTIGRCLRGRTLTLALTAGLAPLLFPPAFVTRVVAPMLRAIKESLT